MFGHSKFPQRKMSSRYIFLQKFHSGFKFNCVYGFLPLTIFFVAGYVLKIQLRSHFQSKITEKSGHVPSEIPDQTEGLVAEIIDVFRPCTLQEFHQVQCLEYLTRG